MVAVEPAGEIGEQRRRGQHLAVDVELQLRSGAVPDAHGRRATVARERQLSLIGVVAAVQAVEHLDARMRQLRGMKQPREEGRASLPQPSASSACSVKAASRGHENR